MHKRLGWLGLATIVLASSTVFAQGVLKPYVVMMLDTSGSMVSGAGAVTGSGPPTCGGRDNRLNHARCAINRIVNSYGDMVFALGRFRMASSTNGTFVQCDLDGDGVGLEGDNCVSDGQTCTAADHGGEMLTALVDGGNSAAATWTDFQCGSCGGAGTALSSQPEIWGADSTTPLEGYMQAASAYWRGLATAANGNSIWPSTTAGFDPIRTDPRKTAFLPLGCDPTPACVTNCCTEQCRAYINIMLTDGNASCGEATIPLANMLQTSILDAETVAQCANAIDDDNDLAINDGCAQVGGAAETLCSDALDNDNDGTVNDGCPQAGRRYRIETKVIGFGIPAGDTDIERYAHAGGSPDLPGVNEGYYVNDEASLQLAFSQILADAVKFETCNDEDDDCDGAIDEDFKAPKTVPGKDSTCSNGQVGICARNGTRVCKADGTGLECNAPSVTPGTETLPCNGLDDDCDGKIDENLGCQTCVPTGETCDGNDNDCDGVPDQICRCDNDASIRCDGIGNDCGGGICTCTPITRACGTGSCNGIETCTAANTFTGCTAATPDLEICNGADDDCDGLCDGFTLECSDVVTPGGPGTDNPGDPSNSPIPQNLCRPGQKTCPLDCDGSNSFTACQGEVLPCGPDTPAGTPGCDTCDGNDNDCDNAIDENFQPQECGGTCGTAMTTCNNGQVTCVGTGTALDNTCNNFDEDCDNKFDEHWQCPDVAPADGTCDACDVGTRCDGQPKCLGGAVVCEGTLATTDVCDCKDNDCDGTTDQPSPNLCPGGGQCVNCQCAFGCAAGEFPCPLGKKCEATGTGSFCVNDPCFQVSCGLSTNGNAQTCRPKPGFANEAECVETCTLINDSDSTNLPPCPSGFVCVANTGECRPNNCSTFPEMCTAAETCVGGSCISNPCQGVTCDDGQYCVSGACVPSCADVDCPAGQRCRQGACERDPCDNACPFGQACNDATGQCIEDPCKFRTCADGQWCNPNSGDCEDDACVTSDITCPNAAEVCRGGTCYDSEDLRPDAGAGRYITPGGGGGCSTSGEGSGLALALALGLLLVRRRRAAGGAL